MAGGKLDDTQQSKNDSDMPTNDILIQAKKLLAEGKIEDSLKLVKNYWLENPDDAEAANLFSDLMKESGRSELSKRLHTLAEQLPQVSHPTGHETLSFAESEEDELTAEANDLIDAVKTPIERPSTGGMPTEKLLTEKVSQEKAPAEGTSAGKELAETNKTLTPGGKEFFEAGYGLIDARQHELAAMLLNRAARLAPQEPTVNYELGFALMSMKRFEQAIPHMEQALVEGGDFDTLLNLLVCYTLTRQLSKAHEMLAKINSFSLDAEQKIEASHRLLVLKRLESLRNKAKLNTRDWLYVLYGSILLRPSKQEDRPKEDSHSIGQMLAVMKGVLEGLSAMPEAVEFYGPQSQPLAQALAEFLEIPITGYKGPEQPVQALLVMTWASDIIGPHKSFMPKEKNRNIFSYALTWDEALPVVPEIVGTLAYDELMPWHENNSQEIVKPQLVTPIINQRNFAPQIEKAYKDILSEAHDLESDPRTINSVQEALDYYENKKQHLTLCNPDAFTSRPEYTAEVID
jgi:tetratricopeptide (TPR) repeat protein